MIVECGLFLPYKKNTHTRYRFERRHFHDPKIAKMAMLARLLEADAVTPVYMASAVSGTSSFTSTAALQTAVLVTTTSADYGLIVFGYRIGYGASAAAAGIPVRVFSSDGTTAGTSTAGTIAQVSGRAVNTTGMSSAINFTVEPTVKTYLDGAGQLQPFGGNAIYDYQSDVRPDTFVSAKSTIGVEHVPAANVSTSPQLLFGRC